MKKNQILTYALTLGLMVLLGVLIFAFFKTTFISRDAPVAINTPIQKLSYERGSSKVEMSKPPQRIESRLSGKIISVKAKSNDGIEFVLFDESLKKEFSFRVSARAQVGTESIDTEKNVITLTTSFGNKGLSSIKPGAYATVVTIDPIDAHGPLQAQRVTVNKSPSNKQ